MISSRSPPGGREERGRLSKVLDLSRGFPSHDRFDASFAALDPAGFEKCPLSRSTSLREITSGRVVAVDGKTLRGSLDKASGKSAIHTLSARATVNHVSLGEVRVAAKGNEITAIPELLEPLEISGGIATIDARGCQTAIARGADYYGLAVKDDQPTFHAGIEAYFFEWMEEDFVRVKSSRHETKEQGHGRVECRTYRVCGAPADRPDGGPCAGSKRIGVAARETVGGVKPTGEVHYSILSKRMSARSFGAAVRIVRPRFCKLLG